MIGLDTNVLVRYFAQDDVVQAAAANRLIEEVLSVANRGFISSIVLCELVWVLKKPYHLTKERLLTVINQILVTDVFEVEHRNCALYAANDYATGNADFSDYYLAEIGCEAGCLVTTTFDANASGHPFFATVDSIVKQNLPKESK